MKFYIGQEVYDDFGNYGIIELTKIGLVTKTRYYYVNFGHPLDSSMWMKEHEIEGA